MRRLTVPLAAVAAFAFVVSPAVAQDAATIEKGKAVYESAKPACKACHNERKNPLDNYGAAGNAADAKAWIRTPKEMFTKTGKKGMMPSYADSKISEADLDALAAYLMSLKK